MSGGLWGGRTKMSQRRGRKGKMHGPEDGNLPLVDVIVVDETGRKAIDRTFAELCAWSSVGRR